MHQHRWPIKCPCYVKQTLGKWVCKKFSLWEIIRKCLKTFLWFDTSSPAVVLRVHKWESPLSVSILYHCLWLHLNCVSQSLQVYQGSPSLIGRTLDMLNGLFPNESFQTSTMYSRPTMPSILSMEACINKIFKVRIMESTYWSES